MGPLPPSHFLKCSAVAVLGEFRPECAGPESEAGVVWMELGFAAPSGRGIPARPPVAAQFCICPGARGSEMVWMGTRALASSGGLFLRIGVRVRDRIWVCDGEKWFILWTVAMIEDP